MCRHLMACKKYGLQNWPVAVNMAAFLTDSHI